jgi:enediyne biosynthesis protein E5
MRLSNFLKDARYFQILFQSIFLSYGILFLHWQNEYWLYSTYFITSIITQAACLLIFQPNKNFITALKFALPSVLISSFGLSLLLKTNVWWVAVFAAAISIVSKFILRINGKHVFNPSALGIVATIVLTKQAWLSPGQWGSGFVILAAVACLGFIVVTKVQNLSISLCFIAVFASLLFVRQIIYLQWPIDFFIQSITAGSLLLFAFFMITDPKTVPNHNIAKIIWCSCIAVVAFYLATFKFVNGAPIFVLVIAQLFVPVIDKLFTSNYFTWKPITKKFYTNNHLKINL